MKHSSERERVPNPNMLMISERRKELEQDLAYYEDKLAEVRNSARFAELNLTSLYESRTSHVRKLLTVLPVH